MNAPRPGSTKKRKSNEKTSRTHEEQVLFAPECLKCGKPTAMCAICEYRMEKKDA